MDWHRQWECTQTDLNLLGLKFSCFLVTGEIDGQTLAWTLIVIICIWFRCFLPASVTFGLNELYKRDNSSTFMYELKLGFQQCPRYSHMRISSIFISCKIYVKSLLNVDRVSYLSPLHFVVLQLLDWPYEV